MENINHKKILGRSFILRKRVNWKRPVSYKRGNCYHGLHAGLFSLYVSLRKPQKKLNVSITDK
jgi:hypothetical protein